MKLASNPAYAVIAAHAAKAVRATGRFLKDNVLAACGPEYVAVGPLVNWDEAKARVEGMIGGGMTPIGRDDPALEATEPWQVLPGRHHKCIGYVLASKSPAVAEAHFYRRWNQGVGTFASIKNLAIAYQADGVPLSLPVALTSLDVPRLERAA